jgi:hypothetical protein
VGLCFAGCWASVGTLTNLSLNDRIRDGAVRPVDLDVRHTVLELASSVNPDSLTTLGNIPVVAKVRHNVETGRKMEWWSVDYGRLLDPIGNRYELKYDDADQPAIATFQNAIAADKYFNEKVDGILPTDRQLHWLPDADVQAAWGLSRIRSWVGSARAELLEKQRFEAAQLAARPLSALNTSEFAKRFQASVKGG